MMYIVNIEWHRGYVIATIWEEGNKYKAYKVKVDKKTWDYEVLDKSLKEGYDFHKGYCVRACFKLQEAWDSGERPSKIQSIWF